jgi:rsbT co-antagonist protein RsbR
MSKSDEIRTPIVEVWRNVLLVSIVGVLDTNRTKILTERLLDQLIEQEALVVILDLDGVSIMDTLVAKHVINTIKTIKLMGPEVIISGIRPDVAQTMVSLGVNFDVETFGLLRRAMEHAMNLLGLKVVSK